LASSENSNKGFVVWLTGLPASGKTTISAILGDRLRRIGLRVESLDGDEIRKWLSPNEGFSREDRERHLRRVAHVAQLLSRNGVAVLCAFVSPYHSTRSYARRVIPNFVEVYVKCPIEVCIKRDPKGLYKQAAAGQISNMTGVQDAYEPPSSPELVVDTENAHPEDSADAVFLKLQQTGYLG
jgi:adenylylsulfate kinase